jgi:hypothetical protein
MSAEHLGLPDFLTLLMLQADDEYMITDNDLLISRYISVPRSYGSFNPGALVAGVVRGILDTAGFPAL